MPEIIIEDAGKFKPLYNLPPEINTVVLIGGRGGRKTYETSKYIAKSVAIDNKRCLILRDEKSLIKESILNDILNRYDHANQYGHFNSKYERQETGIKDRSTGETLLFTKGFRASDGQKKANLKGSSNIDISVIEEAEDVRDVDKFNTFRDSLRKQGNVIIIILNTPDINHWIVKRFFHCEPVEENGKILDGYFQLRPKEIKGFMCIQSDYTDNPYLPASTISDYKGYGDPASHLYNPFYFYTAIKGYASTGRKGQILTKVKPITLKEYLALPYKEVFGQDFGTSSPAGMVGVKIHRNKSWCRQINYKPMEVLDIGKFYCDLKFNRGDIIIADNADKNACEKLANGWNPKDLSKEDVLKYPKLIEGFNVKKCIKEPIRDGIDKMISMELYAVEESKDLWNEVYNYIWAKDKNENPTDEPGDDFNHLIDVWRYILRYFENSNFVSSVGI
jgi:phage terminase large subunit